MPPIDQIPLSAKSSRQSFETITPPSSTTKWCAHSASHSLRKLQAIKSFGPSCVVRLELLVAWGDIRGEMGALATSVRVGLGSRVNGGSKLLEVLLSGGSDKGTLLEDSDICCTNDCWRSFLMSDRRFFL